LFGARRRVTPSSGVFPRSAFEANLGQRASNDHILKAGFLVERFGIPGGDAGPVSAAATGRYRPRRPPAPPIDASAPPSATRPMTSDSTFVRLLAAPLRIAYRLVTSLVAVALGLVKLVVVAALFVVASAFVLQAVGVGVDPGAVGLPDPLDGGAEMAPGDPNESGYTDGSVEIDSGTVERLVHEKVNERRTERGLDPLEWNPTAASVSRAHSEDMADRDYFSHTNPDGQGPFDRYREVASGCRAYGENIALSWAGRPVETDSGAVETYESDEELATALVGQWMNSTGHRENMLRERWESGGVGVYITDDGKVLATHNFCRGWTL